MFMQEPFWKRASLLLRVKEVAGSSRYEKIVGMIEESEKLKSSVESNAEHLADRLVPYTLGRYSCNISAYQKCDQGVGSTDGRFLLCTETCHADFRIVCDP